MNIKAIGKYVLGGLALLGLGIVTVITMNKFKTGDIISTIREWAFLRSRDYTREDDVITTPTNHEIHIPEPLVDKKVTGVGTVEKEVEGEILHETTNRRNVTPIENSAKKYLTKDE